MRDVAETETGGQGEQGEQGGQFILSTLDKGLVVLELLARQGGARGLTLTELSRALCMNRTTCFRFLTTLRARGYVERDRATDRYRLGIRVLFLSSALLGTLDLRRIAKPHLERLCDDTGELVQLTMLDGDEMVTLERVRSKQALALQTAEVGARRPAYCTAGGKATIAYLPPDEVGRILAGGMPARTARTITTPEAMRDHLAHVRERGFAWDDEEWIPDVRCVAAPVFNHEGGVMGTVSVCMPLVRTPLARLWALGAAAAAAAAAISRELGGDAGRGDRPVAGAALSSMAGLVVGE